MSLDPVVMFFLLGLFAGLAKSELKLSPAIEDFLSVALLLSIGLKGGIELHHLPFVALWPKVLAVLLMGFTIPLVLYPVLKRLGRMDRADAASVAAHYGSVSVGTFAVAAAYLTQAKVTYEAYMPLFVVVLEAPAIVIGVLLAKGIRKGAPWRMTAHEIFLGKGMVLMLGGLAIGAIAGPQSLSQVGDFFFGMFKGLLALFLLGMGLLTASKIGGLRQHGLFLVVFGLLTPLLLGVVGLGVGHAIGLSIGGATLMATLAASASYIAVPAAMKTAVPEANPSVSLGVALGVTFPFNVLVGIPLYHEWAQRLLG